MNQRRVTFLFILVLLGFVSVAIKLVDLMILEHERLAERAHEQHVKMESIEPRRGAIYDSRMRELAVNREVQSLYGVPREITDPTLVAKRLSPYVRMNNHSLIKRLSLDKSFVWLGRKLDDNAVQKIRRLNLSPQVGFVPETMRTYPKGSLGAHVIGFVNMDNKGSEGLELKYDKSLRGRSEQRQHGMDAHGRALSSGGVYGTMGNSLVLTLDEDLQYIVEKELFDAVKKWKASSAVSILMEPDTGRILAMAVSPTFSPEHPDKPEHWRNRAVTDIYEPGSTFKSILAAAALEEGIAKPSDRFDCSKGYIEVGGRKIRDDHRHKILSFAEVIQKSSNVGAVKIAQKVGKDRFYGYIRSFGFGAKTGSDLPGEVRGILRAPKRWSGSSIGALAVGYEVAVTPLQMLNAYCAIANGGVLMRPYIVSEILDADGQTVQSFSPEPIRRVISERTSAVLTGILEKVVQEGGTAVRASVLGNPVAGKTGTARKLNSNGRYSRKRYVSSFVGFVPSDRPRLAIIVVVDEPKGSIYGGKVAAPVFRKIAEHALIYLNVPRENNGNILLVSDQG